MTGNLPPPLPGATNETKLTWVPPPLPDFEAPKPPASTSAVPRKETDHRQEPLQVPPLPKPKSAPTRPDKGALQTPAAMIEKEVVVTSAANAGGTMVPPQPAERTRIPNVSTEPHPAPITPAKPQGDGARKSKAHHSGTVVALAGFVAALLVAGGGGYNYLIAQQKLAQAEAEQKSVAMAQRIATEQVARAEAERKAIELAAQLAGQKAQEAQPQNSEPAQAASAAAPRTAETAVTTAVLAGGGAQKLTSSKAADVAPLRDLISRFTLSASVPQIRAMLVASSANDDAAIDAAAQRISELPAPSRGDRKQARALNQEGLALLQGNDNGAAANSFLRAALVDPADPEILGNLAHAYLKSGDLETASDAAILSLTLTPRRASSWGTFAMVLAKSNPQKMPTAVAAYQNAFRFAGSQDKAREYLQKLAIEDDDSSVRLLAENVLSTLVALKSHGSDSNRALGR